MALRYWRYWRFGRSTGPVLVLGAGKDFEEAGVRPI